MSSGPTITQVGALIYDPLRHVLRAFGRLPEKVLVRAGGERPRWTSLVDALHSEVQELEDALWALLTERWVDTAKGVQLDVLGAIVGEDRRGRSDAGYRPAVTARIAINRSAGRPRDILLVAELLVGTTDLEYEDAPGAGLPLIIVRRSEPPTGVQPDPYVFAGMLREARASGVPLVHEYATAPAASSFTLSSTSSSVTGSAAQGLGDTAVPATGGQLAGEA